jgi:hypothetical protein
VTPPIIEDSRAFLASLFRAAVSAAAPRACLAQGGVRADADHPAASRRRLEKEMPMWARLIKQRGITAQ